MIIRVTRVDIQYSQQLLEEKILPGGRFCPVAVAIRRYLGISIKYSENADVVVSERNIWIPNLKDRWSINTPHLVQQKIEEFDQTQKLEPFEFELDV